MENDKDIQSSFIPKQALTKESPARRRELPGLFTLLSLVILISAIVFFGGTYYYKLSVQSDVDKVTQSLEVRRRNLSVQESLMPQIERLDKQLKRAVSLLDGHNTLSMVFRFLERRTLQSIRYNSFSQQGETLNIRGTAANYEGIALQSNIFAKEQVAKDFVFSDLNTTSSDNRVGFNLQIEFSPLLFSYKAELAATQTANAASATSSTPQPETQN